MNESIEQLTASLQELQKTYCHADSSETVAGGKVAVEQLQVSKEVESFVTKTREYLEKTRDVSVGTY